MKVLSFFLIFTVLVGCSNSSSDAPTTTVTPIPVVDGEQNVKSIELADIAFSNNFKIMPEGYINVGTTNNQIKELDYQIFLKNNSNKRFNLRFAFPNKNGFFIKRNFCPEIIEVDKSCELIISFRSLNLKNGEYYDSLEINSNGSFISTKFKAKVIDQESNIANLTSNITISISSGFLYESTLPYRKITITNNSNNNSILNFEIPTGYRIKSNTCPEFLAPSMTCEVDLLYVDYKTNSPIVGFFKVRGNFPVKTIELLTGSDRVVLSPVYSNYTENTLNACEGTSYATRTVTGCRLLVDGVDKGIAPKEDCASYETESNLRKLINSPAGIKSTNISNGVVEMSCLEGQSTGVNKFICNNDFHQENNQCLFNTQQCSVLNGQGEKYWQVDSYTSCEAKTCSLNYHVENKTCLLDTYTATYPVNPLLACEGTRNVQPTGCFQNWGTFSSVNVLNCSGQSQTFSSPSGIKNVAVSNGIKQISCLAGQTTGSETINCNSNFHNENNICISDSQPCSTAPNSIAGIKTWNGSSYNTCVATACSTGYHINNGSCDVNTYTPVYSNPLQPCDGILNNVDPVSCNENWGTNNSVNKSFCISQKGSLQSPAGNKNVSISNGTQNIFCEQGQTNFNIISTTCNDSEQPQGYHESNNTCVANKITCSPLPIGVNVGYQTWNGTIYAACQIESCQQSYRLFNNQCYLAQFRAEYQANDLIACEGQRTVSPVKCFKEYGDLGETDLSDCIGMTQLQKSPAGLKYVSIQNGQVKTTCSEGFTSGSDEYLCDLSFHAESLQCLPNVKSCTTTELDNLYALIGTKTWNGSSYDSCVISTCKNNYHKNGDQCDLNTYLAIFDQSPLSVCQGQVTLNALECREAWSNNITSLANCSDQTEVRSSPAGSITYSISHGTRTDTCSIGSSTPTNISLVCETQYLAFNNQCIYNNPPQMNGTLTLGSSYFQTLAPTMSFAPATDPDGNTISYEYSIGTSSGGQQITAWTALTTTGTNPLTNVSPNTNPVTGPVMPAQSENTIVYINVRAKDQYGVYSSNTLTSSYTYILGWPYGLQTTIPGSSGACAFSGGHLIVSNGTCTIPAGVNYDFKDVTIDATGVLKIQYDTATTYNLNPTDNPSQSVTTTGIQKYTIIGVSGVLINNGTIQAEDSPFIHTQDLSTTAIRAFTVPMPSGSQSTALTSVSISNASSGNGTTYYHNVEYTTTNVDSVPFSTGGLYGGGGGGINLDNTVFAGASQAGNTAVIAAGTFSTGSYPASQSGQACASATANGSVELSVSGQMAAGGKGGSSLVNKYFCGSGGYSGLARISSIPTLSPQNGYKNAASGGGGGARGANGQILVIHTHALIQGTGSINARGSIGGNGGVNRSCIIKDFSNVDFVTDCLLASNGRGGNGAGGSGGKVYIISPTTNRYLTIRTTSSIAGTGGNGGASGFVGSSTYILGK